MELLWILYIVSLKIALKSLLMLKEEYSVKNIKEIDIFYVVCVIAIMLK